MYGITVPGEPKRQGFEWPIAVVPSSIILELVYYGDPIAHQRPRMGKGGHFYTPDKTRKYRDGLSDAIKVAMYGMPLNVDKESIYGVQANFYRGTRQRIDVDNLIKTVFDAITQAGIWYDDSRVHETAARIIKASADPRVEFVIYRLDEKLKTRTSGRYQFNENCQHCGRSLKEVKSKSYPSTIRKFCSQECARAFKTVTIECTQCHKEFTIPRSLHRRNPRPEGGWYPRQFCSRQCSIEFHKNLKRIKGKESDRWICTKCGGRVSRKEYKVCRACSMLTRSDPSSNYWKLRHVSTIPHTEIEIRPLNEAL